jgi:hypothetical protein
MPGWHQHLRSTWDSNAKLREAWHNTWDEYFVTVTGAIRSRPPGPNPGPTELPVQQVFSRVPEDRKKILKEAISATGLGELLKRHPVGFVFTSQLPPNIGGNCDISREYSQIKIHYDQFAPPSHLPAPKGGKPWGPGIESPHHVAGELSPDTYDTYDREHFHFLVHELGHHLHSVLLRSYSRSTPEVFGTVNPEWNDEFRKKYYSLLESSRAGATQHVDSPVGMVLAGIESASRRNKTKNSRYISKYSQANAMEYFAESFAAYVHHKEEYKKNFPADFDLMERAIALASEE